MIESIFLCHAIRLTISISMVLIAVVGCSPRYDEAHPVVEEFFQGATWTADSNACYLARYRIISLLRKGKPSAWKNRKVLSAKLHLFRWQREHPDLTLMKSFDYLYQGLPVGLRFGNILHNNHLMFQDVYHTWSVDLGTWSMTKSDRQPGLDTHNEVVFVRRSDVIRLNRENGSKVTRYLSPDRRAYVEIHDRKVGLFYDVHGNLKTMYELGWRGGIPSPHIKDRVRQPPPQKVLTHDALELPNDQE